jgi:hypothetical protein
MLSKPAPIRADRVSVGSLQPPLRCQPVSRCAALALPRLDHRAAFRELASGLTPLVLFRRLPNE